jgi:hypothetical protein
VSFDAESYIGSAKGCLILIEKPHPRTRRGVSATKVARD